VTRPYDAIIVGGGHNGLVAAHYLSAKTRLRILVLERRDIVGGPSGTIEIFPGYRGSFTNSPGSLEPKIVKDMALEQNGLEWTRPDPSLVMPFPDGRAFQARRDRQQTREVIRSFSEHDATAYSALIDYLNAFAKRLGVSVFEPPPTLAEVTRRLRTSEDEEAFAKIMFGSIKDLLDEWLESEEMKAVLGMLSIMSSLAGPSTPGTPYMLLHRPMSLASSRISSAHDPRKQPFRGSTGLPVGGMGSIVAAMERSIKASGAEVRTEAEVVSITTHGDRASGVVLATGEHIEADVVLSNLNPKTTLLDLLPEGALSADFASRVRNLHMAGNQFKVALAVDGLPTFAAAKNREEAVAFSRCQFRIAPSLDYLERNYDDAKQGRWSRYPAIWGLIPTASDPSQAPEGKHLVSLNVYHGPYHLKEGSWTFEKEKFADHCVAIMCDYMPDLKDRIIDRRAWSPKDLEDEFGLLEGNITHGDMMPIRAFGLRPMSGWADYRTPVAGLYLCGSGTWPGGYVSGLPGHNASHVVLSDVKEARKSRRPHGGSAFKA
jgi:phytoene dehydrogenase-like protein